MGQPGPEPAERYRKTISFRLTPAPPFRLDLTAWTLRRRPENKLDTWDGETYRRVLALNDGTVQVRVRQDGATNVEVTAASDSRLSRASVARALERMLGLDVDLQPFYRVAARDPRLNPLVERFRGAKPPRFPTVFEALANGISCQQLSLAVGIILLNRLAEAYGPAFPSPGAANVYAFPRPEDLAAANPDHLRTLGYSGSKARVLVELGGVAASGKVDLEGLADLDDEEAVARLQALRGVGRWTAEYVLLRGLGRTDRFPGDDVGARNSLARWLGIEEPLDYGAVGRVMQQWTGYAGLIYFHLLLKKLDAAGYLTQLPQPLSESHPPAAPGRLRRKSARH